MTPSKQQDTTDWHCVGMVPAASCVTPSLACGERSLALVVHPLLLATPPTFPPPVAPARTAPARAAPTGSGAGAGANCHV